MAKEESKAPKTTSKKRKKASKKSRSPSPAPKSVASEKAKGEGIDVTTLFLVITAAIFVGVMAHAWWKNASPDSRTELSIATLAAEKVELQKELANRDLPLEELHTQLNGANLDQVRAYIAFYASGRWQGEGWGTGSGLKGAINAAWKSAKAATSKGETTEAFLVIPTDRHRLRSQNYKGLLSNVHRGVRGVLILEDAEEGKKPVSNELIYGLSPTKTIATNRPLVEELEQSAKERDIKLVDWLEQTRAYAFDARQFIIPLKEGAKAVETLRGNRVIPVSDVTQKSTQEYARLLGEWMFNNLHPGGRMTYMYYPSSGREAGNSNNMIRQWMGTVAMGRVAAIHPELNLGPRVEENIRYNLTKFYRTEGDLGYIEYQNTAKLGAAALAMISLIESPARPSFQAEEEGLMNLTLYLWRPSGEYITFFKPKGRNENHNFYPGETLLAWSFLYDESKDPELLKKCMASFRYYKKWHLENRNPAFIPWHTQAYYNLWKHTKDEDLKAWIFEMNDWLVDTMQSGSRVAYDDTIGRFYAPKENFGRPHASSTGVYLEGLIDAFAMAREIGDTHHEEKYRKAIVYGIRSSMQLQFQDDIDMFYVTNRNRLRGGMRTTVYDNAIRVDNVQHVLMGVQKILREFKESDYKP